MWIVSYMANILDSSVWVALFLDFDKDHVRAESIFSTIGGTIFVPYCIINEVATVLTYKHSKQQADSFLAYLEYAENVVIFEDKIREECAYYVSHQYKISFTDSTLLFLSRKVDATLVTFDKQLIRLAKKSKIQ